LTPGGEIHPALVRWLGHTLAANEHLVAGRLLAALDPGRACAIGERQAVGQRTLGIQHIEPVIPFLAVLQHGVPGKEAPLLEFPALHSPFATWLKSAT